MKQGYLIPKEKRVIDRTTSASRLKLKKPDFMTDEELMKVPAGSVFVFDVECYTNFFYVAFKCLANQKYVAVEQSPAWELNIDKMLWLMYRFCIVGFNSRNYDLPIITLAAKGATCEELKEATNFIIEGDNNVWAFQKHYNLKVPDFNHIDIIEVAPLQGSLKLYAGRLHCPTMQDLPFPPEHIVSQDDAKVIRPYCCNDLENTEILFHDLAPELKLRLDMSRDYGVELRSKSDAQIAETVINGELQKLSGYYPKKPKFDPDLVLQYNVPDFISFKCPQLNKALDLISNATFTLDKGGKPKWPEGLGERVKKKNGSAWELRVIAGEHAYKLGMGGLHSQESSVSYIADENTIIADNDVASYYPRIILNQKLFPPHLGEDFLDVYESIVNRRLEAKRTGNKVVADSLKITINGSFGKLGSKYSALYAPQLMLQVTLTGQLALLMLIEMLEEAGISCVSGNTDGVVSMYPKERHEEVRAIISEWESKTQFQTEETRYKALYSRDVNNYIAVKEDDTCKTKGTYGKSGLSKNPEHYICSEAVLAFVTNETPVEDTIRRCQDVRSFLSVRNVRGGGEKDGLYLGKVVRWYYAKGEKTAINYVGSGNKVAKSDGAKPLMDLPDALPTDIDYDFYIKKATEMLYDCGALRHPETPTFF